MGRAIKRRSQTLLRSAAAAVIYTSPRANPPVPEFGAIAQLGERYNGIVEVSGSIPLGSTIKITGLAING